MTRFSKIYGKYLNKNSVKSKEKKPNSLNREGYGYIKRRVGLLSNELNGPTYLALSELSDFISTHKTKSSK